MNPKRLRATLTKARTTYAIAFNCYTRYMWRPATESGRKDHARYEKHRAAAEDLLADALAMVPGDTR